MVQRVLKTKVKYSDKKSIDGTKEKKKWSPAAVQHFKFMLLLNVSHRSENCISILEQGRRLYSVTRHILQSRNILLVAHSLVSHEHLIKQ